MTAETHRTVKPIEQARHPELARFLNDHAILRGSFTLVSGRKSTYYCDGKQASFSGEGLTLITEAILQELDGVEADAIGGMDMGATPIVAAVALRAQLAGRTLPAFVVRKDVKAHGTQKAIEGICPEDARQLVIVDDVITSGGSTIRAIEAVRRTGREVALVLSVLDRESGGREALEAIDVRYRPLVTIRDLGLTNDEPKT